jgi:uncharacterized membrane protein YgdD (TMEM256/DUF423 family)
VFTRLAAAAALMAAVAVASGGFGAHALASRLGARELELWQTGSRYLTLAALGGLAIAGASAALSVRAAAAGWLVLAGGVVFASTLFGLALGGPRILGAVTPLGGAAMILGFHWFAVAVWRDGGA